MNLIQNLRYLALKKLKAQIILTQEIYLIDAKGRKHDRSFKVSDSLTGNFLQLIYVGLSEINTVDYLNSTFHGINSNSKIFDTTGASQLINIDTGLKGNIPFNCHPGSNTSLYGLVWGTGSTPPTPIDTSLETLITTGNGAGQLSYQQGISTQCPTVVGANTSFVQSRLAINTSGADVTVNETGIYLREPSNAFSFMIYRDLTGGKTVPNTETLATNVTWQVAT